MSEQQLTDYDAAVLQGRVKHLEIVHSEILREFGHLTTRLFLFEEEIRKTREDVSALREDTRVGLSIILSRLPGGDTHGEG